MSTIMARHLKIKTEEDHKIHLGAVFGVTYTLCGLETAGDSGLGIEEATITKEPINCHHCIGIVKFCKTIKPSEYQYNQQ